LVAEAQLVQKKKQVSARRRSGSGTVVSAIAYASRSERSAGAPP
jgi:hypothetical protein